MRYIATAEDIGRGCLGGKAEALARLTAADVPIPAWFAVRPEAFTASLAATASSGDGVPPAVAPLDALRLAPAVEAEVHAALDRLPGPPRYVAVRSSAEDEDGAQHSFAGQLRSFLFVPRPAVADRIVEVWRSAFDASVQTYRTAHDLDAAPRPPAVLIQCMVEADRAGVAFSADPATGRRTTAVVTAVQGLGSALVDGLTEGDTYHVDRQGTVAAIATGRQRCAHRGAPAGGVQPVALPPSEEPLLDEPEVQAIARLARQVAREAGRPQDIEWASADGRLWLLQARPITTLAGQPDPDGAVTLWDNSNIGESYHGVTTPLTFSFVRTAYAAVYRSFCRQMGVTETTLDAHASTFRSMIGLIQGRIYYNLISWYDALALLPGFRFNRAFMEDMMGVSERLPAALRRPPAAVSRWARWRDAARLARQAGRLVVALVRLPRQTERFYVRLDDALDDSADALADLRLDELGQAYRHLEAALLTRWDAPIVNDFFAMVFFGWSKRLAEAWLPEAPGLHNDLLSEQGDIVSVEPARRLRAMAELAADDPALCDLLVGGAAPVIEAALRDRPALAAQVAAYLDRFGDRCPNELKLESATLTDEPLLLYRSIGHLAQRRDVAAAEPPASRREAAEERVSQALQRRPLRRWLFRWVLKQARVLVARRENLRFERTRVFNRARRLFLEMGRRLVADGVLDEVHHVSYLEADEVLGYIEGTATTETLRPLAAARRAAFDRYREAPAPPDRFLARGAVHACATFEPAAAPAPSDAASGDLRIGLAGGPGVVRGRVRVVRDPRAASVEPGDILVAERTDPGWILLFTACAGLVVEHGSLLSHAAIVARELGLPTVVSLVDATTWLADGDYVEVNGHTGQVRKLSAAPASIPHPEEVCYAD